MKLEVGNMITHELEQGTSDWHQFRSKHFGASEASAMLGMSPYVTRTELLHTKSTGIVKDVDAATQRIFDRGHEVEAMARPIVEAMLDIELFPVTCSEGRLSASCDGLSMCETIAWENKQFNADLYQQVIDGELPEMHWPQCQQVLFVTGAEKLFFTISDGTEEKTAGVWVLPDQEKQRQIVDGWAQFEKDLAGYVPAEIIELPKHEPIKDLPAVTVQVRGELTLCNLSDVTPLFDKFIAEAKTELVTDDDFAQAEAEAKLGRETAKRCKLTAKAVVDQMMSVSEVTRTLEEYAAKFDALALKQEKAVKAQKEAIKASIVQEAKAAFSNHCAGLKHEINPIALVVPEPDFAGAVKNKRTLASLHDSVDTELANAKIAADAVAKDIRGKLAICRTEYADYQFLFNDIQALIYKPLDDFKLMLSSRVDQHKKAEAAKLEAERKRIQGQEEAKAKAEQERKLEAERAKIRAEEAEKAKVIAAEERRIAEEQRKAEAKVRADQDPEANLSPKTQQVIQDFQDEGFEIESTSVTETITIPLAEFNRLVRDSELLEALKFAGVDNWDGYSVAVSMLESEA